MFTPMAHEKMKNGFIPMQPGTFPVYPPANHSQKSVQPRMIYPQPPTATPQNKAGGIFHPTMPPNLQNATTVNLSMPLQMVNPNLPILPNQPFIQQQIIPQPQWLPPVPPGMAGDFPAADNVGGYVSFPPPPQIPPEHLPPPPPEPHPAGGQPVYYAENQNTTVFTNFNTNFMPVQVPDMMKPGNIVQQPMTDRVNVPRNVSKTVTGPTTPIKDIPTPVKDVPKSEKADTKPVRDVTENLQKVIITDLKKKEVTNLDTEDLVVTAKSPVKKISSRQSSS